MSANRHAIRSNSGLAVAIAGIAALVGNVATAQTQIQRLTAPIPTVGARFGDAVVMSPQALVVGTPGENAVHVFDYVRGSGFAWSQSLAPASSTSTSGFGTAVALDGKLLAIGAPGEDSVYVSSRRVDGTFDPLVRLQAPVPQAGAKFGFTIALRGDLLVVGARFQDGRNGAVHVFARQTDGSFLETGLLRPSSGRSGDEFGTCVAFDDDATTLFVSAMQDDDGASDAGAVYVFDGSGGAFTVAGKLISPDAAPTDRAGRALACSGDLLAVGVRNDDDRGSICCMAIVASAVRRARRRCRVARM